MNTQDKFGENPFPHALPSGKVVENERCYCGALRTEHALGRFGAFGHGGCARTSCEQFTFKKRIYATSRLTARERVLPGLIEEANRCLSALDVALNAGLDFDAIDALAEWLANHVREDVQPDWEKFPRATAMYERKGFRRLGIDAVLKDARGRIPT